MTTPTRFRVSWTRVTAAAVAAVALATIPAAITGEWLQAAAGIAIAILAAAIFAAGIAVGRASAKAEQIYREELKRGPDITPADPAMDLRVHPDTTGETR